MNFPLIRSFGPASARFVVRLETMTKHTGKHPGTCAQFLQIPYHSGPAKPQRCWYAKKASAHMSDSLETAGGRRLRFKIALAQCPAVSRLEATTQQPGYVCAFFCYGFVHHSIARKDHPKAALSDSQKEVRVLAPR